MIVENRTFSDRPARSSLHPSIASGTVAFALSRGLEVEQISRAVGLNGQDLVNPNRRLPDEIMPKIWRLLAASVPSEQPLTMEMARAAPLSLFADISHGIQFAGNMREAVELLAQHSQIIADRIEANVFEEGANVALVAAHPLDALDGGRSAELGLALAWRLIAHVAKDPLRPVRIDFSHAPTGALAGYAALFGLTPSFGTRRNAIVLRRSDLNGPVEQASEELFAYVRRHLAQMQANLLGNGVRDPLEPLRSAAFDLAEIGEFRPRAVATAAGIGYRTAQRMAAEHGTTIGKLVEGNRLVRAQRLLAQSQNTIEGIALILGYADDRTFRRAFKRHFGVTPSAYRGTPDQPQMRFGGI